MSKTNLLVICPPDHYALRNLAPLKDVAEISVSNDEAEVERLARNAEVILYSGLTGRAVHFQDVWKHAGCDGCIRFRRAWKRCCFRH